jgi:hypothetical protein
MRAHVLMAISVLFVSTFLLPTAQAQQDSADAPSSKMTKAKENDPTVEGTVISTTRRTLVVRSDDDQYHLFTYDNGSVQNRSIHPGARVRVSGTGPDENGTQVANDVTVLAPAAGDRASSNSAQVHAAPPPQQVQQVANEIEGEARRWHGGGRIGVGFSPELFTFGVQSQIGPIFSSRLLFRPNTEFAFGELTNMVDVNLEMAYRFNTTFRRGWTPYFGLGPSLNFIHQGINKSDISWGNFDYKTGFNVLVGAQRRHTFVEMKTGLWSGAAPVLRLIVGYNF